MGVVFQDFKLIRRKTALENVAYVLNVSGVSRAEQKRRAYAALKGVGLNHKLNVLAPALSGGEQQRVAIARAVVNEPRILIADEPTGNLDPTAASQIFSLMQKYRDRETLVLVATHAEDWRQRHPGRVIRLEQGVVKSDERLQGDGGSA